MEKTYYQIDDKFYYLDLNAIFSFITATPAEEKPVNTTITQYYGEENGGKEVVESKANLNDTMNNVKYDFIKNIVNCLLQGKYGEDGLPVGITHFGEFSFAQGLCFNTLVEHKFLLEVESDE